MDSASFHTFLWNNNAFKLLSPLVGNKQNVETFTNSPGNSLIWVTKDQASLAVDKDVRLQWLEFLHAGFSTQLIIHPFLDQCLQTLVGREMLSRDVVMLCNDCSRWGSGQRGRLVFPLSNHSWMNFRVCHSVSGDGALHEFGTVGKVVGCFHLWIPRYPTVTVTGRLFGFLVIPGKILSVLCSLCCWQAGTIPHHRELVTLQLQFSWEIPDHLHSKLNSIYWGL